MYQMNKMNKINTEAKNEVRELLGELVVSPIVNNLTGIFTEVSEQIKKLDELKTNQDSIKTNLNGVRRLFTTDIKGEFSNLSETINIINKKTKDIKSNEEEMGKTLNILDGTLKEKTEGLSSNLSHLEEEMGKTLNILDGTLKEKTEGLSSNLSHLEEEMGNTLNALDGTLKEKTEGLSSNLSHLEEEMGKTLNILDGTLKERLESIDKSLSSLYTLLNTCQNGLTNLIDERFKLHTGKMQECIETEYSKIGDLEVKISEIQKQSENLEQSNSTQLDKILTEILNNSNSTTQCFEAIDNTVKEKSLLATDGQLQVYKQNKTSFVVILIVSLLNLAGLIYLISLRFL